MSIKVGWSLWTKIRLLFVKPVITIDPCDKFCWVKGKILDGKLYVIAQGHANTRQEQRTDK